MLSIAFIVCMYSSFILQPAQLYYHVTTARYVTHSLQP